jgi:hypothetical protein
MCNFKFKWSTHKRRRDGVYLDFQRVTKSLCVRSRLSGQWEKKKSGFHVKTDRCVDMVCWSCIGVDRSLYEPPERLLHLLLVHCSAAAWSRSSDRSYVNLNWTGLLCTKKHGPEEIQKRTQRQSSVSKNTSDLKFRRIPIAYDVFCRQYITKTYTLLTEAYYTTIQEMFHFIILHKTHITGGVV